VPGVEAFSKGVEPNAVHDRHEAALEIEAIGLRPEAFPEDAHRRFPGQAVLRETRIECGARGEAEFDALA
jgi:hypothetical protein